MGKLIVIEGTDGSGKSTQFRMLTDRLEREKRVFQKLVFPQYAEPSSALIRMYLNGEFGSKPTDVNAYAASAFFSVDRYASYKKVWGKWYEEGGKCGVLRTFTKKSTAMWRPVWRINYGLYAAGNRL